LIIIKSKKKENVCIEDVPIAVEIEVAVPYPVMG
jgi:hypothetical protein